MAGIVNEDYFGIRIQYVVLSPAGPLSSRFYFVM